MPRPPWPGVPPLWRAAPPALLPQGLGPQELLQALQELAPQVPQELEPLEPALQVPQGRLGLQPLQAPPEMPWLLPS